MKTVQMTLDDDLIKLVDKTAKTLNANRSGFTRDALRQALHQYNTKRLEEQHKAGHEKLPVTDNEFSVWEEEQVWGAL